MPAANRRRRTAVVGGVAVVVLVVVGVCLVVRHGTHEGSDPGRRDPRDLTTTTSSAPLVQVPAVPAELRSQVDEALAGAAAADVAALRTYLETDRGNLLSNSMTAIIETGVADLADCGAPGVLKHGGSEAMLAAAAAVPDRILNEAALAAVSDAQALELACEAPDQAGAAELARRLRVDAAVYRGRLEQAGIEP